MAELKTLNSLKVWYPTKTGMMKDVVILGNATEEAARELRKRELVDRIELKQEAIKYVKDLERKNSGFNRLEQQVAYSESGERNLKFFFIDGLGNKITLSQAEYMEYMRENDEFIEAKNKDLHLARWIKDFFNLTKEDLKE